MFAIHSWRRVTMWSQYTHTCRANTLNVARNGPCTVSSYNCNYNCNYRVRDQTAFDPTGINSRAWLTIWGPAPGPARWKRPHPFPVRPQVCLSSLHQYGNGQVCWYSVPQASVKSQVSSLHCADHTAYQMPVEHNGVACTHLQLSLWQTWMFRDTIKK